MKKIFLVLMICAASTMIFAQRNNNRRTPPNSVERSWKKDHPNNNDNDPWEWNNNRWHRKYMDKDHNNRKVDVYYDNSGRRMYSQYDWDRNELPDRVKNRIRSKYRNDN